MSQKLNSSKGKGSKEKLIKNFNYSPSVPSAETKWVNSTIFLLLSSCLGAKPDKKRRERVNVRKRNVWNFVLYSVSFNIMFILYLVWFSPKAGNSRSGHA